ncbi:hypothetical protein BDB00DRAFT_977395 [Zychaea mexicana]|uniref:uncharacterized protein n=1 Tax=Zychaea mexicana TaxID=64656 RepID=UPI0022FE3110|nr:uncharacterized protein BDB00DRAFT_977395 [Zychaea mexicana]KAI9492053.1 hypothetical protein BDB00DRAFT_977395 [Zychaea mexicana]
MESNYSGHAPLGRNLGDLRRYADDPYRAARRGDSGTDFDDILSLSPGSDIAHSRSASDSSTRKLTGSPAPVPLRDYYEDDPYARQANNETKRNSKAGYLERIAERANSYLPYSHHQRDPNAPVAPIYIEDTTSVVADKDRTISLQPELMLANNNNNNNNNNSAERVIGGTAAEADQLEFSRKKKKRRRWCGMRKRIVALLVLLLCTVVALIWYFVWPRVPQLTFLEVDAPAYDYVNSNGTQQDYFNASWVLNMTADNTANWIPTHIRDMAVTVVYRDTSEPFGHGNSGSLQLFPRTLQNVEIPISIRYTANTEDPTYVALSNACGPRSSTSGFIVPTNTFNINFLVQISIDGIAWSNSRNISVPPGFSCPLPHD